jgi:hypothetical protein
VHAADGFVAIRDIAPKADTHLARPAGAARSSFREISEFPAEEAKRMLDFIAETAKEAGLEDYRVVVNVGEGRRPDRLPSPLARARRACPGDARVSLIARLEDELKQAMAAATPSGATPCG